MSGSKSGSIAVVLGALGVAAVPVAVVSSWYFGGVELLRAIEMGVVVAFALGLVALALARRGRFRLARTVSRKGAGVVRMGRLLAWGSIYVATTGAIALGFYGLLVVRG
jgi:hypothetical protein